MSHVIVIASCLVWGWPQGEGCKIRRKSRVTAWGEGDAEGEGKKVKRKGILGTHGLEPEREC